MALTRLAVETAMAGQGRLREVLQSLGRSLVTTGANPDLNEPMAAALESFGILPIDRSAVSDADLAKLDDSIIPAYLDLVEIRALEFFANAIAVKSRKQQWEDYSIDRTDQMEWLLQLLKLKQDRYDGRVNLGAGPAAVQMDCQVRGDLCIDEQRARRCFWSNDPDNRCER